MRLPHLMVIAVLATLLGCDKNPAAPSAVASGEWSGTIADPVNGAGTLAMVVGSVLQGTWALQFPDQPQLRGTFVGAAGQGTADFALTPAAPLPCTGPSPSQLAGNISLNVTVTTARLSGRSTFVSCQGIVEGTVELTR